jgi:signal transduction histidine kinase/CheY-like chemotaxis protein
MASFLARVLSARTLARAAVVTALIMVVSVVGQTPCSAPAAGAVQALAGAQRSCGASPVQQVALPDVVEVQRGRVGPVRCVYRLVVGGAPSGSGIFIPRLAAHAVISVNGHEVSSSLTDPMQPEPRSMDRIVLLEVPGVLWNGSDNVVEIHAAGPRRITLSKVRVGPIVQLRREHRMRVLGAVIGPSLAGAIVGTLGLCILLLWVSRRDSLYGYFGAGTLFWGFHTLWSVSPWSPLSGAHLTVWWTTLYTFFVAMLIIFCVRFAEWRHAGVERLLWAVPLATPLVLYAAVAVDRIDLADNLVRLVLLAMVGLGVVAVMRASFRRPDVDKSFVMASGLASFGFGVHDWLTNLRANGDTAIYLVPYAGLIFVVFVVRMLVSRFARVTDQLEAMNVELGQRVASQNTELRHAMEEMRQARDAAEAADHAKTRFLAAASHDLRQPAHALALYMAALRAERLDARQADLVERMSGSLSALGALFNMLLDMSRIDAGALAPAVKTFTIEPLLRRLADEFAPQADAKGLRLALRLPSTGMADAAFTHSDPLLVERVVRNLLANAVKYTSQGGVLLACRLRHGMTGSAAARPPQWRVEVWDTGVGIADEDKERVFEEFFQVDNPGRDGARGLGLGLSIVHRMVKLLGLELVLHTRFGRGSCFAIYLPHASGTANTSIVAPATTTAAAVAGLRVGMIEDDTAVRDAMRTLLQHWGCDVIDGADADELDRQARRLDWKTLPHALLVDQRLGAGKTGPAQARRLFELWGAEVPVLIVSGESDLSPMKAAGWDCLAKPLSPALLMAWLASVPVLPRPFGMKARTQASAAGERP